MKHFKCDVPNYEFTFDNGKLFNSKLILLTFPVNFSCLISNITEKQPFVRTAIACLASDRYVDNFW